jgi:hypothetical protein
MRTEFKVCAPPPVRYQEVERGFEVRGLRRPRNPVEPEPQITDSTSLHLPVFDACNEMLLGALQLIRFPRKVGVNCSVGST